MGAAILAAPISCLKLIRFYFVSICAVPFLCLYSLRFCSNSCPSTVSLGALIRFRSRNEPFSASSRESAALRGGVLVYAAQAIPQTCRAFGVIDAEIADKGHLWTETNSQRENHRTLDDGASRTDFPARKPSQHGFLHDQ